MTIEKEAREIVERTKNRPRWDMENQTYVPETFPWLEKDIAKALQKKQDRIEELEQIRMKLISKNMALSTKIKELESALKEIADASTDFFEEEMEAQVINLKGIAKKAIGGGNEGD